MPEQRYPYHKPNMFSLHKTMHYPSYNYKQLEWYAFRFHRIYTLSSVAKEKLVSNTVLTCINIFKLLVKPITHGFLSDANISI